ncbi:MAG TPA: hypothetical protein GYA10_07890 [Alphaproteobacteria bacterium]|nr:hypothetical protein [Alphaproteobacteria bacterium]
MTDRAERADMRVLRAQQAEGGARIAARLAEMRDYYARTISKMVAKRWFMDATVHLDENGVYVGTADVPEAVLERHTPGDSWAAFETVERWLLMTRGAASPEDFWEPLLRTRIASRDIVLLLAISNALGKAERLLNEQEQRSGGARGPRASADRKAVSDGELLTHRAAFEKQHGTVRGWQKCASIELGLSESTIRDRLKKLKKIRR